MDDIVSLFVVFFVFKALGGTMVCIISPIRFELGI